MGGSPDTSSKPTKSISHAIRDAKHQARESREKRQSKPQPYIVLKLTIAIALALIGYVSYVYIGRLCVSLIRQRRLALGVGLLVGYCILLGMTLWSYIKVVFTSPGKAKNHVPCGVAQPAPTFPTFLPTTRDTESDTSSQPDEFRGLRYDTPHEVNTNPLGAITGDRTHVPMDPIPAQPMPPPPGYSLNGVTVKDITVRRIPSKTPQLLPEFRYCSKEKLVKPYRAHHCRACGACILKYDHHCPWIGQCVGARNHKFFIIFNYWTALYTSYVFASLVGQVAQDDEELDPQFIIALALAALFALFTFSLFCTHVRLVVLNQTTVEHFGFKDQRDRESAQFAKLGFCVFREKRRALKLLDKDWGRINTEGNIWWRDGGVGENWEEVMGKGWLRWMLPIGKSPSDGLSYEPSRKRFDELGRWKPKQEWTTTV